MRTIAIASRLVHSVAALAITVQHHHDDEFNLFLFSILMVGIVTVFVCVVVGIILTILALAAIFGLISMGALSASLIVGIHQKSVAKGFKAFAIIFATSATGFIGAITFWLVNTVMKWSSDVVAIFTGLSIGLVSGFLTGIVIAFAIQKIVPLLKNILVSQKRLIP